MHDRAQGRDRRERHVVVGRSGSERAPRERRIRSIQLQPRGLRPRVSIFRNRARSALVVLLVDVLAPQAHPIHYLLFSWKFWIFC